MSKGGHWIAPDGSEITDEMIGRWCDSYDRGEFPEGERTVGGVIQGRPPLSANGTVTVSLKVPSGMKLAIEGAAEQRGMSSSAYMRGAIAEALLRSA